MGNLKSIDIRSLYYPQIQDFNMTSRFLDFALKKSRDKSYEGDDKASPTDADEIDQRLNDELAFLIGATPEELNSPQPLPTNKTQQPIENNVKPTFATNNLLFFPQATSASIPQPQLPDISKSAFVTNNFSFIPQTTTPSILLSPLQDIAKSTFTTPNLPFAPQSTAISAPVSQSSGNFNTALPANNIPISPQTTVSSTPLLPLPDDLKNVSNNIDKRDDKPPEKPQPSGYTISVAPSDRGRKFEQFFPPKSKEQLEREALNPPRVKDPNWEDLSKPFKCEECGLRVMSKNYLELHINTKHKGIKSFACTLCSYRCAQKANLEVHMKGTHNQTEKFQCNACQVIIAQKRELGNHMKAAHGRSIYGRGKEEPLYTAIYVTFIEP